MIGRGDHNGLGGRLCGPCCRGHGCRGRRWRRRRGHACRRRGGGGQLRLQRVGNGRRLTAARRCHCHKRARHKSHHPPSKTRKCHVQSVTKQNLRDVCVTPRRFHFLISFRPGLISSRRRLLRLSCLFRSLLARCHRRRQLLLPSAPRSGSRAPARLPGHPEFQSRRAA